MATSTTYSPPAVNTANAVGVARVVLALALLGVLTIPLLYAAPGPLSSDESLYIAEGLNIAEGKGYTYPNGDLVQHRAPLFPAILAADFSVAGASVDSAAWVSRLFALGNVALLALLAWRMFGRDTGLLTAGLALGSAFLTIIGTSVFLDGVETFFLLAMLICFHTALARGSPRWAGLTGVSFGLAMLTKESAVLWLPLPFVALLLAGEAVPRQRAMLLAYGAGFLATAGWWWPYVFALTGDIYLIGDPASGALWLGAAAIAAALPAFVCVSNGRAGRALSASARWLFAGAGVLLWGGVFLLGLESHSSWDYPRDYIHNVPDYVTTIVEGWLWPLPLVALAWCYTVYRARSERNDQLIVIGALLFLPFAIFIANRALHLRDALPLVYLSYLVLARGTIDFARWSAQSIQPRFSPTFAGALAIVFVVASFSWFTVQELTRFVDARAGFLAYDVRQDNWDNPLVQETALWFDEHVPAGSHVMSGRLYHSHLYTLTDGRYPWWQLPTVRVDLSGDPPAPETASTLFRWEDHELDDALGGPWLYLRRLSTKGYYVALSERELLRQIDEHEIEYLVVTGDDAGFSSLSLLPYFDEHPAFDAVVSFAFDDENQTHVYRVAPTRLQPIEPPARVSNLTVGALYRRYGERDAEALLSGLSPHGYVVTNEYGVPDREETP